jgi:multisubunit Na+/H+ antiporter MnhE subunit
VIANRESRWCRPLRRRVEGSVGRVVEVVVWWALLVGVWLVMLVAFSPVELVAGAVAALPCAAAAVAGRRAIGGVWRARPGWLRWLLPLPLAVVAESGRVLLVPFRRGSRRSGSGRLEEVRLQRERPQAVARTRQAIATIVVSVPPGTLVVDVRSDDDVLVVHRLVGGRGRLEEAISS